VGIRAAPSRPARNMLDRDNSPGPLEALLNAPNDASARGWLEAASPLTP
jgi:hypothetical protein